MTYANTLTEGEGRKRVTVRVLYAYCQSFCDLRRYSDRGGVGRE